MKYLGILLMVALVFVGSVAMAGIPSQVGQDPTYAIKGDSFSYKGPGYPGSWQCEILFKVIVTDYVEVSIPNTILEWTVLDPGKDGEWDSESLDKPLVMTVKANYPYGIQFYGFKNPELRQGNSVLDEVPGWWKFKHGNTESDWLGEGSNPYVISNIPGDGQSYNINIYTKIKIDTIHRSGEYSDHDVRIDLIPSS